MPTTNTPTCRTCNDTHRAPISGGVREVDCKDCPIPCGRCAAGAYCSVAPYPCQCHKARELERIQRAQTELMARVQQLERNLSRPTGIDSGFALDMQTSSPNPTGRDLVYTGNMRVYFNRHGAGNKPWCVAGVSECWEVAVKIVSIHIAAETVYAPKPTSDDEDGRPSAWLVVDGQLHVTSEGIATITSQ